MTSIMGRIRIGDIETAREQFLRARGSKPPCCVEHDSVKNRAKCDQTDWLSESDFQKRCLKCQSEIAEFLGVDQK